MLLSNLIQENIEKYGEYPLLYFEDRTYTNVESDRYSSRFAGVLESMGIEKGDRVLVCMPNCPEVIFSYQAILRAGAIVVPVMFLLHAKEIAYILENSAAKMIITSSQMLSKIQEAVNSLAEKPMILLVDAVAEPPVLNLREFMEQEEQFALQIQHDPQPDDVAVILYTSGTTGSPKGVMLTHRNLYSNAESSALVNGDGRSATLGVLPLAHVYGFTAAHVCFILGSSVVIFNKFDPEKIFQAIETYRIKSFSAVPAMIHAMVVSKSAEQYDLSSLEWVGSGSAPLPVAILEAFRDRYHAEVYEGYGLSEASPVVTTHPRGGVVKPGSVGLPIPGVEIKIVDEQVKELPIGEVGELIVRGLNITSGYYKNENASRKTIVNGWLHTGDLAKVDEDGYLYIVDRQKDLIIRGGFNIYPRDLEELLMTHQAVSEAAVVGVASSQMGEEVICYVVKKAGTEVTEAELIQYCQDHLAKYKTPRRIILIDQLPRNGVGKILKQPLREMSTDVELFLS